MVLSDLPIHLPSEDQYGVDPFAKALARSLECIHSPEGTVVALNGAWGSGKSSVVNLVLHHLKPAQEAGRLKAVTFNPWWFSGSESLTLAFFEELQSAFDKSNLDTAKSVVKWLGKRLSRTGPLLGAMVDIATAGVGGNITTAVAEFATNALGEEQTVEAAHAALTQALREQTSRFLIVIDDIDRLGPDEALLVFRLVKSVGKLPNVIYLLAFDRLLAERIISERFPAEGANYLEKIVQATFDLPIPDPAVLRRTFLGAAEAIACAPTEDRVVRFMNFFHDVVAPYLQSPRNAIRLANVLNVTWPAVKGEVDTADFLCLETLRVFEPIVSRSLRANASLVCGVSDSHDREDRAERMLRYELTSA